MHSLAYCTCGAERVPSVALPGRACAPAAPRRFLGLCRALHRCNHSLRKPPILSYRSGDKGRRWESTFLSSISSAIPGAVGGCPSPPAAGPCPSRRLRKVAMLSAGAQRELISPTQPQRLFVHSFLWRQSSTSVK